METERVSSALASSKVINFTPRLRFRLRPSERSSKAGQGSLDHVLIGLRFSFQQAETDPLRYTGVGSI
jgi:hypothetical protein